MGFWNNFWSSLKRKKPEKTGVNANVQLWEDYLHFNPLDIVVHKLNVFANDEATFTLEANNASAEALKTLCEDLENKRYEITEMMLAKGGCYVTYAVDTNGNGYFRILNPDDVSVKDIDGENIIEIAMVIETKTEEYNVYKLVRHHKLENGDLSITYYTTNADGQVVRYEPWEAYREDGVTYEQANNIGVAYFKSPKNSRGVEPFEGVPLNFACQELEKTIREDRAAVTRELANAEIKLFVDASITRAKKDSGQILSDSVYTIQKKAGVDGSLIDVFAPQLSDRVEAYIQKLDRSYRDYENQIGVDGGFLSDASKTATATATEVRFANIKTISMVKSIQSAVAKGVKDALESAEVFCGVAHDTWTVLIDWYNAFDDETAQFERLFKSAQNGFAEARDVVRWLFPDMEETAIDKKLERIRQQSQSNMDESLDRILRGE